MGVNLPDLHILGKDYVLTKNSEASLDEILLNGRIARFTNGKPISNQEVTISRKKTIFKTLAAWLENISPYEAILIDKGFTEKSQISSLEEFVQFMETPEKGVMLIDFDMNLANKLRQPLRMNGFRLDHLYSSLWYGEATLRYNSLDYAAVIINDAPYGDDSLDREKLGSLISQLSNTHADFYFLTSSKLELKKYWMPFLLKESALFKSQNILNVYKDIINSISGEIVEFSTEVKSDLRNILSSCDILKKEAYRKRITSTEPKILSAIKGLWELAKQYTLEGVVGEFVEVKQGAVLFEDLIVRTDDMGDISNVLLVQKYIMQRKQAYFNLPRTLLMIQGEGKNGHQIQERIPGQSLRMLLHGYDNHSDQRFIKFREEFVKFISKSIWNYKSLVEDFLNKKNSPDLPKTELEIVRKAYFDNFKMYCETVGNDSKKFKFAINNIMSQFLTDESHVMPVLDTSLKNIIPKFEEGTTFDEILDKMFAEDDFETFFRDNFYFVDQTVKGGHFYEDLAQVLSTPELGFSPESRVASLEYFISLDAELEARCVTDDAMELLKNFGMVYRCLRRVELHINHYIPQVKFDENLTESEKRTEVTYLIENVRHFKELANKYIKETITDVTWAFANSTEFGHDGQDMMFKYEVLSNTGGKLTDIINGVESSTNPLVKAYGGLIILQRLLIQEHDFYKNLNYDQFVEKRVDQLG